jgi:hypothetical protein
MALDAGSFMRTGAILAENPESESFRRIPYESLSDLEVFDVCCGA